MKLKPLVYFLLFLSIFSFKNEAEESSSKELIIENASIHMELPSDVTSVTHEKGPELIKGIPENAQKQIKLISPSKDLITLDRSILIKGVNHYLTPTFVNGVPVRIRKDGRFFHSYTLPSNRSKSSIWVTWITTYNRIIVEQRKLIYLKSFENQKNKNFHLLTLINSPYFLSEKTPALSDTVTRAQLAVLMAMMTSENIPIHSSSSVYEDVPQDYWASGPIAYMVSKTYLLEFSDGKFRPDGPIKKLDYIISMARLLHLNLETLSGSLPYSDVNPSHWSTKFVKAMYQQKLLPNTKNLKGQELLTWADLGVLATLIPNLESHVAKLTDFKTEFEVSIDEAQSRLKPAIIAAKERAEKERLAKIKVAAVIVSPVIKPVKVIPVEHKKLETEKKQAETTISRYQDLKGHWVETTAEKLKQNKILDFGNRFDPEKIVTQKEVYQILVSVLHPSALGNKNLNTTPATRMAVIEIMAKLNLIPEVSPKDMSQLFVDVHKNKHQKALLEKAYAAGLITEDKYFYPNQLITRAELATTLTRFPQVRKTFASEHL